MGRIDEIVSAVLEETEGITFDGIKTYNRSHEYSIPRQLIMYLLVEQGYSSTEIAKVMHRTHVTVLYGHNAVVTWLEYPSCYKRGYEFYKRVKNKLDIFQEQ